MNWVDDHKAAIAGFAVGLAVGVGCGALIGWTGVGAVACGALAGAAGAMVSYMVETEVEHKGEFSLGGLLKAGAIGAITGAITGGLGSIAGQGLKAGGSALLSGSGLRGALSLGGRAGAQEARAITTGFARGATGKAAAGGGRSAGGNAAPAAGAASFLVPPSSPAPPETPMRERASRSSRWQWATRCWRPIR